MIDKFDRSCILLVLLCCAMSACGQKTFRLTPEKGKLQVVNREIKIVPDPAKGPVVRSDAKEKPGLIWVNNLKFETGSIEFDVKGKDVLQESFVGIAFHGENDVTYEAVYFRPFNFNAKDSLRKAHAVQYMALPGYDWPMLRERFPGKYEFPIAFYMDPNEWFHVRVVVSEKLISVFLNDKEKSVLQIVPLVRPVNGKIGFWLGNGSDGSFANLVINRG